MSPLTIISYDFLLWKTVNNILKNLFYSMFYSDMSCFWACNTIICICLCANQHQISDNWRAELLRDSSSYWELHSSTMSIPSDLHEAEMWVMYVSACMRVWIHYWLLIWATSFPRRVQKAEPERESEWNETLEKRAAGWMEMIGLQATLPSPVRSDSVTRSQSACLWTSPNTNQYSYKSGS